MAPSEMRDRVCLVTGATAGIGKATALGIARTGAQVVLIGRNAQRGEDAQAEIKAQSGNERVDLLLADLASQRSIRQLAAEVLARYPQLHVLVNNAGGIWNKRIVTVDGFEATFAVNHLAYFLLTNLLLDRLKSSPEARIINVSSDAHEKRTIDFDDLQAERSYKIWRAYGQSKLANILFTYELAQRLADSGVTANCLHPGFVASNFGRNTGLLGRLIALARPFALSSEKGALTSIYLATSPEVADVSGKYFVKCKEAKSSAISHDEAMAKRLWQVSEELTGLAQGMPA